jgi:hypothetical protein
MTTRFPLIVNAGTAQIQELPAGDDLDLQLSNIANVINITATGDVSAGNVTVTNVTGTMLTASQPNITGLGTLGSLTVTGNISAGNLSVSGIESVGTLTINNDATIVGNLTVQGNTITANVTSLVVSDPIINLGRGANNTPLTSNDGLDRGVEMFYYTTEEQIAFMGYDNNQSKMILASNVSVSNNVITVNAFGTTQMGGLEAATATVTGNISAGNLSGTNIVGTVATASQPNITSVGTLGSLAVTGNVSAGNLALTTALPASSGGTGITALGTGVATFLGTPSSANLAAALTDETGTGLAVFGTNPTLTGVTLAGEAACADNLVTRATLKDYAIEGSAVGNTGATRTFDLSVANFFSATLNQACTFTFSNPPASGDFGAFVLELTNGGAFQITYPASVDFPGGVAPQLTASGVDQLVFTTRDGGTTYFAFVAGLDIKSP